MQYKTQSCIVLNQAVDDGFCWIFQNDNCLKVPICDLNREYTRFRNENVEQLIHELKQTILEETIIEEIFQMISIDLPYNPLVLSCLQNCFEKSDLRLTSCENLYMKIEMYPLTSNCERQGLEELKEKINCNDVSWTFNEFQCGSISDLPGELCKSENFYEIFQDYDTVNDCFKTLFGNKMVYYCIGHSHKDLGTHTVDHWVSLYYCNRNGCILQWNN